MHQRNLNRNLKADEYGDGTEEFNIELEQQAQPSIS